MVENVMPSIRLKKRSDLHLARKIWHMTTVFAMFLAWVYLPEIVSISILALALAAFVPFDILRHRYPALNEWAVSVFRPIMRQAEVDRLAGTTYLICGVFLIVVFFPRPVVSLTLLFLAFADPLASYVGILYGKDKIFGQKSLQGFLAAFAVCASLSLLFLWSAPQSFERVLLCSLLAGLLGAVAELLPVGKLDDNFTLPVLSAIGLKALFAFFGFFPSPF